MLTHPSSISSDLNLPAIEAGLREQVRTFLKDISPSGWYLFILCLSVAGSGFRVLRPEVAGFNVHPFLLPTALAFVTLVLPNLTRIPSATLWLMLAFVTVHFLSSLMGESYRSSWAATFRIMISFATMLTVAELIRTRRDFEIGCIGLAIGLSVMAWGAFTGGTDEGVNPLADVRGNKNAYSLYALPGIFLAGYIILHSRSLTMPWKTGLGACVFVMCATIVLAGNRSGWLGIAMIAAILVWSQRTKGFVLVAALVIGVGYWGITFSTTKAATHRYTRTLEGDESDYLRLMLVREGLLLGVENPLLGVSPELLPYRLAKRVSSALRTDLVMPHNLYAFLLGGSGVFALGLYLAYLHSLWNWAPGTLNNQSESTNNPSAATSLVRMMIILFVVRGFFSEDILFIPGFNFGLGLVLGLKLAETEVTDRVLLVKNVVQQRWGRQVRTPSLEMVSRL